MPPIKAHHLMLTSLLKSYKKERLRPTPDDLDKMASVFRKAGGSWERLYQGSVDDMVLLKKVVKIAVKGGHVTKAPSWIS
jgi:hypothetical protein